MKWIPLVAVATSLGLARAHAQASPHPGPFVRTHDRETVSVPAASAVAGSGTHAPAFEICRKAGFTVLARHADPVQGGGSLNPIAFTNPSNVSGACGIAFFSLVDGASRNQGIFVADRAGMRAIAMGCGGGGGSGNPGGGCGDPSPIGGTFSGFFGGTVFAPASNAEGDVLFIADVDGGSAPRGLFLHRESTNTIVKIAAVGDALPGGGTISAIGPGSVNARGTVVFLSAGATIDDHRIVRWTNGVLTSIAKVGDPAPGGSTFQYLGGESFGFVDGTSVPTGPLPDINDSGIVAFRGILADGTTRGILVSSGGVHTWYVKAGEPAAGGGTYFDFQAPCINNTGDVAFFADYRPTPTTFSSGIFAGQPGSWRKAISFLDPVAGGECFGLAFVRNPMDTLNEHGDVVFWTSVRFPGGLEREHVIVSRANGALEVGVRQGDASPLGGTFGTMDAWPSIGGSGCATWNGATPGSGVLSAHMLFR